MMKTYYVLNDTAGNTLAYEPVGIVHGTPADANALANTESKKYGTCRVVTEDAWHAIEAKQIQHRQRFPFGNL